MFGRIDWDDRVASVFFLFGSAINAGVVKGPSILGWYLGDVVYVLGSGPGAVEVTGAKVLALVALFGTIATNRTDFSKLVGIEYWIAITTIGLVIAPPFMPLVESLITGSIIIGLFSIMLQAGGFYAISYLG